MTDHRVTVQVLQGQVPPFQVQLLATVLMQILVLIIQSQVLPPNSTSVVPSCSRQPQVSITASPYYLVLVQL